MWGGLWKKKRVNTITFPRRIAEDTLDIVNNIYQIRERHGLGIELCKKFKVEIEAIPYIIVIPHKRVTTSPISMWCSISNAILSSSRPTSLRNLVSFENLSLSYLIQILFLSNITDFLIFFRATISESILLRHRYT